MMNKNTNKTTIEECRRTMQTLRENSYFDRFRQAPNENIQGQEENTPAIPQQPENNDVNVPAPNTEEHPTNVDNGGDVLSDIRKAIINGLSQYANNIESPVYQTLKKLFAVVDKCEDDTTNDNKTVNNN